MEKDKDQELRNDWTVKLKRRVLATLTIPIFLFAFQISLGQDSQSFREITTPSGVVMILIPGGDFVMGDATGEIDEIPHEVSLSAFFMDKYLVTQAEYEKVIGNNPSRWPGRNNPVEQMRWSDAVRYCNGRSRLEGLQPCYNLENWTCDFSANGYRLPTEAEWEYACRAGTETRYFFGDDRSKLRNFAWFKENSGQRPRPVGRKLPNPFGLFDMLGNVWQWCNDFYQVDYYEASPRRNPKGPESGETRVVRGGSWAAEADQCRPSFRYHENPSYTDVCFGYDIYGFRCIRSATDHQQGQFE
jgi:formylglycine-generating enzyme required for sulfatase activity